MKILAIILILIVLPFNNSFAQAKDTILLQEVIIESRIKKQKVKRHRTSGSKATLQGSAIHKILSRIDNIPAGELSTIKFYFDDSVIKSQTDAENKSSSEVKFGLLIYDVNPDGSAGDAISNKEVNFIIPPNYDGSLKLDLKPLNIITSESMYFGIEIFDQQTSNNYVLMTVVDKRMPDAFYVKLWNDETFLRRNYGKISIKLDLEILK